MSQRILPHILLAAAIAATACSEVDTTGTDPQQNPQYNAFADGLASTDGTVFHYDVAADGTIVYAVDSPVRRLQPESGDAKGCSRPTN